MRSLVSLLLSALVLVGCPQPSSNDDDVTADDDDSGVVQDDDDSAAIDLDGDGFSVEEGDCDDTRADVNPDAVEVCDPADVDEDCDGLADDADPDGAAGQSAVYVDDDGDGYGRFGTGTARCDEVPGTASEDGDCDDQDNTSFPGAPLRCDLADNDCDGAVTDGGLVTIVATGATGTSIQAALNTAPIGGTIHVCPGTYAEALVVERPVLVQGIGGQGATFLDAGGLARAIEVTSDSVILADLTVLNGSADEGAGLRADGLGSLTIISVIFVGGTATGAGGNVLLRDLAAFSLSDVRVLDGSAGEGGGITFIDSSGLALDLIVRANQAAVGAGIYIDGGAVTVENGLVELNVASASGGGAYVASDASLLDADLFDNTAAVGAAYHVAGGLLTLTDGSVRRNIAEGGGALFVETNLAVSNMSFGVGADDNAPSDVAVSGGGGFSYGPLVSFACTGDQSASGGPVGCL